MFFNLQIAIGKCQKKVCRILPINTHLRGSIVLEITIIKYCIYMEITLLLPIIYSKNTHIGYKFLTKKYNDETDKSRIRKY